MKTTRLLTIILAIALLAAYGIMGSDYVKQRHQDVSLTGQITADKATLAMVTTPPPDLAQRLSAAQDNLNSLESSFAVAADETNDTNIVNAILQLAGVAGVKAIPLDTDPWVTEKVAERDFNVFRVNLELTGSFDKVLSFIDRLESSPPKTLVIEYLNIERNTDASAGGNINNTTMPVSANVKIAIYALPPGSN